MFERLYLSTAAIYAHHSSYNIKRQVKITIHANNQVHGGGNVEGNRQGGVIKGKKRRNAIRLSNAA